VASVENAVMSNAEAMAVRLQQVGCICFNNAALPAMWGGCCLTCAANVRKSLPYNDIPNNTRSPNLA